MGNFVEHVVGVREECGSRALLDEEMGDCLRVGWG